MNNIKIKICLTKNIKDKYLFISRYIYMKPKVKPMITTQNIFSKNIFTKRASTSENSIIPPHSKYHYTNYLDTNEKQIKQAK